ncbi:MAG TPA: AAA family ATPase [Verrucomicrobiota bacterium]|nr:AAA family ATPase [Verrucomicrobiota bacterium]
MLLRETLVTVLGASAPAVSPPTEVPRLVMKSLKRPSGHALVLTGVRRCGKSTLQQQLRRRERGPAVFRNLEDTRLYGLGPADFSTLLSVLEEHHPGAAVYLDEVQEVPEWQRLVGRSV